MSNHPYDDDLHPLHGSAKEWTDYDEPPLDLPHDTFQAAVWWGTALLRDMLVAVSRPPVPLGTQRHAWAAFATRLNVGARLLPDHSTDVYVVAIIVPAPWDVTTVPDRLSDAVDAWVGRDVRGLGRCREVEFGQITTWGVANHAIAIDRPEDVTVRANFAPDDVATLEVV